MAVNDAYFKPVLHDTLTGKLSDLAGCFFLPLWISALLALGTGWPLRRRLAIGCASTAMLFTAISTSRLAAGALCAAGRAYRPAFDGDGFSAGDPASLTPPLHLADGTPFTPPGGGTGPFATTLDCRGVPAGTVPPSFALSCASPDGPVCDAVLTQRP
jgi:hypothetical protein